MTLLSITADLDREPWADIGRCVRLDDGRMVVAETTWALFNVAARALAASPIAIDDSVRGDG